MPGKNAEVTKRLDSASEGFHRGYNSGSGAPDDPYRQVGVGGRRRANGPSREGKDGPLAGGLTFGVGISQTGENIYWSQGVFSAAPVSARATRASNTAFCRSGAPASEAANRPIVCAIDPVAPSVSFISAPLFLSHYHSSKRPLQRGNSGVTRWLRKARFRLPQSNIGRT